MTASPHKLSLFSAILINLNIMLGSGIFINTVILSKQAGSLGAGVYAIVGILLLPLILAIAQLMKISTYGGTFYHFGSLISPYFGFISSWSYFIAKMASSALGIHVCISLLQEIIPALKVIPVLLFDCVVIVLFTGLNTFNLKIGQKIQYSFIFFKLIPITFAIFAGIYLFSGAHFTQSSMFFEGIPGCIPLVLFAFAGFEASCSLSRSIENPDRNGPRAILISYALVVTIVILYQLLFYGSLGTQLAQLVDYRNAFPTLIAKLFGPTASLGSILTAFMHIAIASSSLGAAYGIMYSNSWNLFTLAQHDHVFAKPLISAINVHHMPYVCVFIEGLLALAYIIVSQGHQIPLQQVSALGSTIAYTLSSIALFTVLWGQGTISLTALLSIGSCSLLIASFVWSIASKGITGLLLLFVLILIFGTFMFWKKKTGQRTISV